MANDKAVLTTTEAWNYVGGRAFFEELIRAYPELLKPLAVGKSTGKKLDGAPKRGKTKYLKETIDRTLKAAQMDRRFVEA